MAQNYSKSLRAARKCVLLALSVLYDLGALFVWLLRRSLGTILGGFAGYLVVLLHNSFHLTMEGKRLLMQVIQDYSDGDTNYQILPRITQYDLQLLMARAWMSYMGILIHVIKRLCYLCYHSSHETFQARATPPRGKTRCPSKQDTVACFTYQIACRINTNVSGLCICRILDGLDEYRGGLENCKTRNNSKVGTESFAAMRIKILYSEWHTCWKRLCCLVVQGAVIDLQGALSKFYKIVRSWRGSDADCSHWHSCW